MTKEMIKKVPSKDEEKGVLGAIESYTGESERDSRSTPAR